MLELAASNLRPVPGPIARPHAASSSTCARWPAGPAAAAPARADITALHRREHDAGQPSGARRRARLRPADRRVRVRIRVHARRSAAAAPSLKTGMGNVLLQTPVPFFGFQPYFTTGGGFYQRDARHAPGHGLRPEHRRRREGDAGRAAAAARGLPGLQAGKRCAVLASAPHLRRTESEVLSVALLAESRDERAIRLTSSALTRTPRRTACRASLHLGCGNASARMFDTV